MSWREKEQAITNLNFLFDLTWVVGFHNQRFGFHDSFFLKKLTSWKSELIVVKINSSNWVKYHAWVWGQTWNLIWASTPFSSASKSFALQAPSDGCRAPSRRSTSARPFSSKQSNLVGFVKFVNEGTFFYSNWYQHFLGTKLINH